tara:strand:- start:10656 stop:10784 length:129 start_codon:yes stop_codon:yes gene_type:complete
MYQLERNSDKVSKNAEKKKPKMKLSELFTDLKKKMNEKKKKK